MHKNLKDIILKLCLKYLSEDLIKCRDTSCTRKGHMDVLKMSVLPRWIDKFNATSRNLPARFSEEHLFQLF